jgi:DNA invertase Pin-like site-specific DNA recombinase
MHDPAEKLTWNDIAWPHSRGPGSGKDAWVKFAVNVAHANHGLKHLVEKQSAVIRALKGEVALLKRQIAERKPPGGRPLTDEALVARIEDEIERGGSDRGIGRQLKVSHMTVYRIRQRRRQRQLVEPG